MRTNYLFRDRQVVLHDTVFSLFIFLGSAIVCAGVVAAMMVAGYSDDIVVTSSVVLSLPIMVGGHYHLYRHDSKLFANYIRTQALEQLPEPERRARLRQRLLAVRTKGAQVLGTYRKTRQESVRLLTRIVNIRARAQQRGLSDVVAEADDIYRSLQGSMERGDEAALRLEQNQAEVSRHLRELDSEVYQLPQVSEQIRHVLQQVDETEQEGRQQRALKKRLRHVEARV